MVVLLASGVVAAWMVQSVGAGHQSDDLAALRQSNASMLRATLDAETFVRGFLNTGSPAFVRRFELSRVAHGDASRSAASLVDGDGRVAASLRREQALFEQWLDEFADPARAGRDLRPPGAGPVSLELAERGQALTDSIREANETSSSLIDARAAAEAQRTGTVTHIAVAGSIIGALLAVLTVLVALAHLRRNLQRPLDRLNATLRRLVRGDWTARAEVEGLDEVVELATAVNRVAVETESLVQEQNARLQREQLLRELIAHIRSGVDEAELLQRTVEAVGPATVGDRVIIRRIVEQGATAVDASWVELGAEPVGDPAEDAQPELSFDRFLEPLTGAFMTGDYLEVSDTQDPSDERLSAVDRRAFADRSVRSALYAPVRHGEKTVAMIVLQDTQQPCQWPEHDVRLIEAVARELGVALSLASVLDAERSMVARLQELDQAKSDFVSTVSHEIRTPITTIRGAVEMLLDGDAGPLSVDQDHMLNLAERNVGRLLALIEDLLTLSRIESDAFRLTMVSVDLVQVVAGAVDTVRPEIERRDQRLRVEIGSEPRFIEGDAAQLERVVVNLLTNASKFTDPGGDITIFIDRHEGASIISVTDTGMGIPEEDQAQLFSRFFRSSTARSQSIKGTGLGLAIVKNIVDRHRGTISVWSTAGVGSRFEVALPDGPASEVAAAPLVVDVPAAQNQSMSADKVTGAGGVSWDES